MYNVRPISDHDPTMKLQTWARPFAELAFSPSATHFVLIIARFRAPAIYPNFTKCSACHEMWHCNITKYCSCHEKWPPWLSLLTHKTLSTMLGATALTLQCTYAQWHCMSQDNLCFWDGTCHAFVTESSYKVSFIPSYCFWGFWTPWAFEPLHTAFTRVNGDPVWGPSCS